MMENEASSSASLKQALKEETARFEQFYLWLEKSMPGVFFKEVSEEWIFLIVHSLMGFKEQEYFSVIHLKNAAISLCIDGPGADVQILENYPLYGIKNYKTYISKEPLPFKDIQAKLRIATIHFTEVTEKIQEPLPSEYVRELESDYAARYPEKKELAKRLIEQIDGIFLKKLSREEQISALEMFERAETRDHCQFEVLYEENWEEKNVSSMHIVLAWKNVPKHNFLYRLAKVVFRHGLMMRSVNAAYIQPYRKNSILMLSFDLHGIGQEASWEAADIADFLQELVTVKYFGSQDLIDNVFVKSKLLRGNFGNYLRSMVSFIHQVLVNVDPNLYSLENVEEGLCRHPELTIRLCEAFEYKCHPVRHDFARFEEIREEFLKLVNLLDTGHETHDLRRKNILLQGMNFITHTLKTNFYLPNKTAFAFRLDPLYLDATPFERNKIFPELPFGIFFIKGMHFLAFHVRFKDLSRGGLRTVFPEKKERMLLERNTVFSECYNLAYTQHKKNKDIPEGGAKGIIFLKPNERLASEAEIYLREMRAAGLEEGEIREKIDLFKSEQKTEYLYQTQRSFIKNFLGLINCEADGTLKEASVVDYWKKPEYIYLGPDENMHNSMIEWIAKESKKVHYKPGGAFISGKPVIGINHKEFGVTSLGVNVYVHEALKFLGIDPHKDTFRIKMTGGPDGDVAGNQILNLYRECRDTAKLIALTDVSGTIYDPDGLDLEECQSLFFASKPIRFYPPHKLHSGGFLLDRERRREPSPYVQQTMCYKKRGSEVIEEWLSGNEMNSIYRNNVHKAEVDIFIPCGGRPRSLRDANYRDFLDDSGRPTAKAIVEGANLYLTPWARHFLEELGVLIIKDSSANKGGVICSSFEILSGLALSDEEFLSHKERLVFEILEKVKKCAYDEANLLLSTQKKTGKYITDLSDEVSKKINLFTDQLLNYLEGIELSDNAQDPLVKTFLNYCPSTLQEGFTERLLSEIPQNHKKAIIASKVAAQLVYQQGLDWYPSLVDIFPLILQDINLIN